MARFRMHSTDRSTAVSGRFGISVSGVVRVRNALRGGALGDRFWELGEGSLQ